MRLGARKATLASGIALAGFAALLLAGCGTGGSSTLPASKQILRLQLSGQSDINTMDPANDTDLYSATPIQLTFPGLIVLNQNLQPIPWAATQLPTVSSDGITWTFNVRPGLKWSDGTPINANTYAYSIDRAMNPCNAEAASYYLLPIKDAGAFNSEKCVNGAPSGPITTLIGDSIKATDPLTLQITLAAPATYFLDAFTYPTSFAVPEQLISQYGEAKWTDHLQDNGGFGGDMFKITQWNHTGDLILKANPNFWGKKPIIQEVDIKFYKTAETAYNAFEAGQSDVGTAPESLLAQAKKKANFHQIGTQAISYLAPNWDDAPFNSLQVRQAFDLALNKDTLANVFNHGAVQATNHIVPSGMPGYNPNLKGPDGTTSTTGNPTMANQLATQYATSTHCGTATDFSKCPAVTLTIPSGSQDTANWAAGIQQMWETAFPKWPISINAIDNRSLFAESQAGQLQIYAIGWIEDYPDPQDWLTTNVACDSSYDFNHACDQQATTLMHEADANPNQTQRLQQYQQAEQIMVTEVAWLSTDQQTAWWENSPKLHNFSIGPGGLTPRESWQSMYLTA